MDWDAIFEEEGARWFHTGGIFAALSETTPAVAQAVNRALAMATPGDTSTATLAEVEAAVRGGSVRVARFAR